MIGETLKFRIPKTDNTNNRFIEYEYKIVNIYENIDMPFGNSVSGGFLNKHFVFIPYFENVELEILWYGNIFSYEKKPPKTLTNQIEFDNKTTDNYFEIWTRSKEISDVNLGYKPFIEGAFSVGVSLLITSVLVFIYGMILTLNMTKKSFNLRYLLGKSQGRILLNKFIFFSGLIFIVSIISFVITYFLVSLIGSYYYSVIYIFENGYIIFNLIWFGFILLSIILVSLLTRVKDVTILLR
ncbi:MAG: hypothetical protein WC907_01050 [Acholeplasmataceae bacterium]